jgi:hypothetical protein
VSIGTIILIILILILTITAPARPVRLLKNIRLLNEFSLLSLLSVVITGASLIAVKRERWIGGEPSRYAKRWDNRPAFLWIAEDLGCCASG